MKILFDTFYENGQMTSVRGYTKVFETLRSMGGLSCLLGITMHSDCTKHYEINAYF